MAAVKEIDPDRLVAALPDLAMVEAVGRSGLFEGLPVKLSWTGEFVAMGAPGLAHLPDFSRDDIVVDTGIGQIVLERPLVTRVDSDGMIKGAALATILARGGAPEKIMRRTFVRADVDLWSRVCFPGHLEYPRTRGGATALLPLIVGGTSLDVFYLKEGPFLILESSGDLDGDRYREIVGATKMLLTYVTGERFDAESCDVVSDQESDTIVEARWHAGRVLPRHIYHPIPVSWAEVVSAHRALKLAGRPTSMLQPRLLSTCLEYVLANPALATTLEYLVRFPETPVEMRGAFLSVALESFTDHLAKVGVLADLHLLPDATWEPVRDRLIEVAAAGCELCTEEQRGALRNRISDLNRPTNNQKLVQPFDVLGVALTDEQKAAIKRRNKLLHQGRLLDPDVVAADRAAWRQAYAIEMNLYTAINALVLKRMGYQGPIIDWGKTSIDSGEQAYAVV